MVKKKLYKNNTKSARKVNSDILIPRLIFIVSTLALVLFGLVMVFSASSAESLKNTGSAFNYFGKQGLYCLIGLTFGLVLWRLFPFSIWRTRFTWVMFFVMFGAMFLTLMFGKDILGAKRWIYIGPVSLQPSEFAKITMVLLISKLYCDYEKNLISPKSFWICSLASTFSVLGFILLCQSDLGTTLICLVGVVASLWFLGIPKKYFLIILISILVIGIFAVFGSSYRTSRFQYLDPYNDGENGYGAGYQIIRSYYAISEGGLFGVGLGNSHEKFQYLPEAETDFIFAIICEELGLFGSIFVIVLYLVFLVSGLYISIRSKTRFGAAVSGSLVLMIVIQAFINIGCVVGYLPTTGKPLPFISSGGSSLIASLFMVGIVLAVSEEDSNVDIFKNRRKTFKAYNGMKAQSNTSRIKANTINSSSLRNSKNKNAKIKNTQRSNNCKSLTINNKTNKKRPSLSNTSKYNNRYLSSKKTSSGNRNTKNNNVTKLSSNRNRSSSKKSFK